MFRLGIVGVHRGDRYNNLEVTVELDRKIYFPIHHCEVEFYLKDGEWKIFEVRIKHFEW